MKAGEEHSVGIQSDGTVVAVGLNSHGQLGQGSLYKWNGLVSVSSGYYHTIGLKADGAAVAVGYNKWGQINLDKLVDIRVP